MKKSLSTVAVLVAVAPFAAAAPALAYFHAGGWSGDRSSWSAHTWRGGTASGGDGSWSATGYRGGTASGGGGSWNATGYRGGTASGGGGSWNATGANGAHYYGGPDYYHGGYYGAYNSPAVVNHYGATCWNCGGWNTGGAVAAGAVAGVAAGAMVAGAANAANSQAAYNAGVAAGQASANPVGTIYGALPSGCNYQLAGNQPYYACASGMWLQPANGVYYRVVPAP
jgi:hypothetical protein